jgi:hypothetical protein
VLVSSSMVSAPCIIIPTSSSQIGRENFNTLLVLKTLNSLFLCSSFDVLGRI